jgi:alpha-tubulin suppressor-like RCC1 family protein
MGRHCVGGQNYFGKCDIPVEIVSVASMSCGGTHAAALTQDGKVLCWGNSSYCSVPAALEFAVAVRCGISHSIALGNNGQLVCWGDDRFGQCSVPTDVTVMMPAILL